MDMDIHRFHAKIDVWEIDKIKYNSDQVDIKPGPQSRESGIPYRTKISRNSSEFCGKNYLLDFGVIPRNLTPIPTEARKYGSSESKISGGIAYQRNSVDTLVGRYLSTYVHDNMHGRSFSPSMSIFSPGLSKQYDRPFFKKMEKETGIKLENIVYYQGKLLVGWIPLRLIELCFFLMV